jgi:hypothetical protein
VFNSRSNEYSLAPQFKWLEYTFNFCKDRGCGRPYPHTALKGVTSTDTETVGLLAALNSVLYLLLRLVRAGAWWACLPGGRGVADEWESDHASTTGSVSPPSGRLGLSIR